MLHARIVREMVTGPLEFGFAGGDDLVAVADFHEILVRTTAEDGQTDQESPSQFTFDSGRAHFRRSTNTLEARVSRTAHGRLRGIISPPTTMTAQKVARATFRVVE